MWRSVRAISLVADDLEKVKLTTVTLETQGAGEGSSTCDDEYTRHISVIPARNSPQFLLDSADV
jgi:hypothetical protein